MIEALMLLITAAGMGDQLAPRAPADPKDVIARVEGCARLTDEEERLKCYDTASVSLSRAIRDGSLVLVGPSQVEKAHRDGFGYSGSDRRVGPLAKLKPVAELKEINSMIQGVRPVRYGRYNLSLADGSVWENVDLLMAAPLPGEKVQIVKTAFGAYLLKVPYSESVHAKRLR